MRIPDYELADMHIHIMPEVDDGSESMEMTMEMLRIARENRIGTMILTPHYKGGHRNVSPEGQLRRIAYMQDAMAQEQMEALSLQMAYNENVTEKLKAENQMLWVQRMNNIRQRAEELVMNDLIYA